MILAAALALGGVGCPMPLEVHRITNPNDAVAGIRYIVQRPSYAVLLRVNLDRQGTYAETAHGVFPLTEAFPGSVPAQGVIACSQEGPRCTKLADAPYCISGAAELSVAIKQTMDGAPLTFEARTASGLNTIPQIFADTEVSLTLDETSGAIAGFSAGATDKSLEFIQAVANLAISAAKGPPPADAPDGTPCLLLTDAKFHKYVADHLALIDTQRELTRARRKAIAGLDTLAPKDLEAALASAVQIDKLAGENATALQAIAYRVPGQHVDLTIDGTGVPLSTKQPDPWFGVTLTTFK